MLKEAILKKLKRKNRGKDKEDRLEWALVSKSNPKKILRWFGTKKPSHERLVKEERRIHSFSSINKGDTMIKELTILANYLDKLGLFKEANTLDSIIKESAKKKEKASEEEIPKEELEAKKEPKKKVKAKKPTKKPTKKQLEVFDVDKDGKPFEKEDFKLLRKKK